MDKRVIKTKKNLYESLLQLMKENSFEEIKVSDICHNALTNRSTFYDHFSDKYDLLSSFINDLREELKTDLDKLEKSNISSREYYLKMIELFLNNIDEKIDIYNAILKRNNHNIVIDLVYDTLYKYIGKEIAENKDSTIPTEIITKFYVTAVSNVCLEYIKYPRKYKKEKLLEYFKVLIPENI